jgi:hypothetical protein
LISPEVVAKQMRDRLRDMEIGASASREGDLILAGVMMEVSIKILRRYGKDQDILYFLADYLTGDGNGKTRS